MILNIFNDLSLIYNENIKDSFMNAISLDIVFIFIIVIFALILFLVFIVLILPLFKPSPSRLYKRYLYFRDEMKRVDALYSQKKIIFEEYVSQQFINAQEYYKVVKILSADPNYKTKLQSYTLQDNLDKSRPVSSSSSRKLTPEEMRLKQINKLCDVLRPKAAFYSKEDVYSVLLYEGFEEGLIRAVLKQLINQNVIFSKESSSNKKDLSLFLDDLIKGKEAANFKNINTSESISFDKKETNDLFKDDFKRKELNFDKIDDVDYTFKTEPVVVEEKPSFFKRLFGIGKKKEAPKPKPSINEIDGILKNIEQELKTKEI